MMKMDAAIDDIRRRFCYYSKTTINTRVDGVTVYIRFTLMVIFRNGTFGVIH